MSNASLLGGTSNAVLDQKLTSLIDKLDEFIDSTKESFERVDTKQNTTNGRISTNERELLQLREQYKYNKIIWYLFTIAIGAIVFLVTHPVSLR